MDGIVEMPTLSRLERTQFIPKPRDEVYAFFSKPENLEQITPPFLRFTILTPRPVAMREGALIDYQLHLFGLPITWQAHIERFEPEQCFVDVQRKGPYAHWHHLHEFSDAPGGTEMRDVVDYALPFGPLGKAAELAFVRRTLDRIFDFRYDTIAELLS